jgi:flagellar hook-length control protein FliK
VQNLSNPLFDEFNISEQITDGVKANLNLEKNEFTVKLNPESLGEVTIKLAEEGGKMVVNITAATESTAKLLNSDLTALRDSLGSLNLEIREVTVEAPESIEESIAEFNMTSQQFSDRQRAFNNQQQDDTPYYAHSDGAYMSEEITADYSGRVRTAVDGLDTYV